MCGKCHCELDVQQLFIKAIEIVESFIAQKDPGIYVKIRLKRNIENKGTPEVRAEVQMYKMQSNGVDKCMFDKTALRIRTCEDLYSFYNYLKINELYH